MTRKRRKAGERVEGTAGGEDGKVIAWAGGGGRDKLEGRGAYAYRGADSVRTLVNTGPRDLRD
jgi:hypothetical protein